MESEPAVREGGFGALVADLIEVVEGYEIFRIGD